MNTITQILNQQFQAVTAVVLYKNNQPDYNTFPHFTHFVQVHRVVDGQIAEGKPISKKALINLVSIIEPEIKEKPAYLPVDVLYYSPLNKLLIWWVAPARRTLFFTKETGLKSGKAFTPGLIFAVLNNRLYLWAVKGDTRPEPHSKIYHAPFFNIGNGGVCLGNASRPQSIDIQSRALWTQTFFESAFTNEAAPPLKGIHVPALWKMAMDRNTESFPAKYLLPYNKQTVASIPRIIGG